MTPTTPRHHRYWAALYRGTVVAVAIADAYGQERGAASASSRKGDEDGNGDGVREEDGKSDGSGMVLIL